MYAWYRFSGASDAIRAYDAAQALYEQSKQAIMENAPTSPDGVLPFLHNTARQYAAAIPGAPAFVDSMFATFDELRKTHGQEVDRILRKGYDEVQQILKDSKGSDVETGMKVMTVLTQRLGELEEMGSQSVLAYMRKNHPEVAEKFGGMYSELRQITEKRGPEAKKIYEDTMQQVRVTCVGDEARELMC